MYTDYNFTYSHGKIVIVILDLGIYLKRVDVESSNWSCMFLALRNDHFTVSSNDFGGVIEDDVAVLSSSDEETRWQTLVFNAMWTPD